MTTIHGHVYVKHGANCERLYCSICDGGLAVCDVCKAAEGELTTQCPGYAVPSDIRDTVYAGALDFKNGEWVAR